MTDEALKVHDDSWCIREITSLDQAFLLDMLFESLYRGPGAPPFDRSILANPDINKYVSNWGQPGDFGLIAETRSSKDLIGAIWLRCFTHQNQGYGYISDAIPEVAMAIKPKWRGLGIGTDLLQSLLRLTERDAPKISLSVNLHNPAIRLYQRAGFSVHLQAKETVTMLLSR